MIYQRSNIYVKLILPPLTINTTLYLITNVVKEFLGSNGIVLSNVFELETIKMKAKKII